MPESPAQEVKRKLLEGGFTRTEPGVAKLADPIAETPMVVTLDELRPYELNPRVTRNPLYDQIKASIRERGLDAPPAITRRPGESHFIIRSGGNTRLSILQELWTETKDDRFFRIHCLFRPWSARGEIVALTGHLAENELHGGLSFIERALGVDKSRELYEQESGKPVSQRELARRLTADGYPISPSLISRMQDAIHYLFPAIPSVLYAGLGKPQIERLIALRKAAARCWDRHANKSPLSIDFSTLFNDVLALFEGETQTFHVKRVQDELVGRLSNVLKVAYGSLSLEIVDATIQQDEWLRDSTQQPLPDENAPILEPKRAEEPASTTLRRPAASDHAPMHPPPGETSSPMEADSDETLPDSDGAIETAAPTSVPSDRLKAHIVTPAETTDRLQAIQRTIAQATGDPVSDFASNVVRAIPVQAGGLHPISDVWYIEPALDVPDRLRTHIAQLATEIAQEAALADRIESTPDGIGFLCTSPVSRAREPASSPFQRAVLTLLHGLSAPYTTKHHSPIDGMRLIDDIGTLLQGLQPSRRMVSVANRLSDAGIVKLFRLIRLARRLLELKGNASQPDIGASR